MTTTTERPPADPATVPYGAPVNRFDPENSPVDGEWRTPYGTPYGAPLANPPSWRFGRYTRARPVVMVAGREVTPTPSQEVPA